MGGKSPGPGLEVCQAGIAEGLVAKGVMRIAEMMHLGVWKGWGRRMKSGGVLAIRKSRAGSGISDLEQVEGIKEQR